jgi:hypothetical protein
MTDVLIVGDAVAGELGCHGQAHRPSTDDEYVRHLVPSHAARSSRVRCTRRPRENVRRGVWRSGDELPRTARRASRLAWSLAQVILQQVSLVLHPIGDVLHRCALASSVQVDHQDVLRRAGLGLLPGNGLGQGRGERAGQRRTRGRRPRAGRDRSRAARSPCGSARSPPPRPGGAHPRSCREGCRGSRPSGPMPTSRPGCNMHRCPTCAGPPSTASACAWPPPIARAVASSRAMRSSS